MAAYFSSLREAASSAAEPASQEAPVTYESASGQVTVTSQHYYYYYYYYVPYNTIVIFLQRKSRRDKSPYTYHVMVAGL